MTNSFPLHDAVFDDDIQTVNQLLASGEDIDGEDSDGNTPLHICVLSRPTLRLIDTLLKSGANIDAVNHDGETPHGADISTRDSEENQTPLEWAMQGDNQSEELMALLE